METRTAAADGRDVGGEFPLELRPPKRSVRSGRLGRPPSGSATSARIVRVVGTTQEPDTQHRPNKNETDQHDRRPQGVARRLSVHNV
jgi:hypothetical protein